MPTSKATYTGPTAASTLAINSQQGCGVSGEHWPDQVDHERLDRVDGGHRRHPLRECFVSPGLRRDPAGLGKLSRYAGDWRYEVPGDERPAGTWEQNRRTGDDVVNDARRRVPELVEKTRSELQRASRAGEGGLEGPPLSAADPRVFQ